MTKMMRDIEREPHEWRLCLERLAGSESIAAAATLLGSGSTIHVAGIGSSWNAALGVASVLCGAGIKAEAADASELLHFGSLERDSTLLVLSRSGRTVEVVELVSKARAAGAKVVAVTNAEPSALAERADVVVLLGAPFDHLVSIGMYSLLTLVGAFIAATVRCHDLRRLTESLNVSLEKAGASVRTWGEQIDRSDWLNGDAATYFLARGPSVASCHEARLLWEEAAKSPATALTTGGFRHGSQEMIRPGVRIALWVNRTILRGEDLQLASELRAAGASVLLIGTNVPVDAGDLVLDVPETPPGWEFVIDIVPVQIAAERLAALRRENCDEFKLCSYVIEAQGGLSGKQASR